VNYLLDTNICIYIINRKPEGVFERFRELSVGQVGISSITYSELCFGIKKSKHWEQNALALEQFISPLEVLPYPEEACMDYGEIRAALELIGKSIGPLDTLIAAHAKHFGYTIVTNNVSEFSRVDGLKVENWV
jgi:tRNA(fMet)-specific endonuclease VapC